MDQVDSINTGKDINIHKSFSKVELRNSKANNYINSPKIEEKSEIKDNIIKPQPNKKEKLESIYENKKEDIKEEESKKNDEQFYNNNNFKESKQDKEKKIIEKNKYN